MVKLMLALAFFVALSFGQYEVERSIEGTWTDARYGGRLYLCVDDNFNVWGTYSEAGVYWGSTTPNQNFAAGRW